MITPKEAEARAQSLIESYVNGADCRGPKDVANVLMKLASMCGLAMVAVVGVDEAVARMNGCKVNTMNSSVSSNKPAAIFSVRGNQTPH